MIKEIVLENTVIKYQITLKNNKNTYFYFKKKGYIQINASKHQKEKEIVKFMKSNSVSFVNKFNKTMNSKKVEQGYKIWGTQFNIEKDTETNYLEIDYDNYVIKEPHSSTEQLKRLYKKTEKDILLKETANLKEKYLNNGLIDISDIKIKTRYTTSRFGSCNYRLKTINLNLKLVHYNKKFIEYVFLHEIAHLVHQNHSTDFYSLLCILCPDYRILKKELNIEFSR